MRARTGDVAGRGPRRVLVGTIEVGGYYRALTEGLRAAGVAADNVDLTAHRFGYAPLPGRPRPIRAAEWIARRRERSRSRGRAAQGAWTLALRLAGFGVLVWSLVRYDAYIFGFGTSFAGLRDLWLLRLLGKRIVCVFHGSDVRPSYLDGPDMDPSLGRGSTGAVRMTQAKRRRIARAERHAHVVVSHPLYAQLFRRRSVSYLAMGVPMAPASAEPPPPRNGAHGLRILHAPSHPVVKGTPVIRAAVAALQAEGRDLEYVEIAGRPNAEVLAAIDAADLVVDQVYSDLPYSILGAEAAARGRCVLLAGYARPWLERLPGGLPPVAWSEPEQLTDSLRALLDDPERRLRLGEEGRRFIADWTPELVGGRFIRLLRDEIDPTWWFDPLAYDYPLGCGLPKARIAELVGEIVRTEGSQALGVGHNRALEAALVRLAG